jgi:hypothetical protein
MPSLTTRMKGKEPFYRLPLFLSQGYFHFAAEDFLGSLPSCSPLPVLVWSWAAVAEALKDLPPTRLYP